MMRFIYWLGLWAGLGLPTSALAIDTILLPVGATWSYLDDGVDPAATWADVGFDDSTWASGPAQLGYGEGDEATLLSFGPDSANKYTTTWFRSEFTVVDPTLFLQLHHRVLRDDGVIVYLNGVEQYRDNMPATGVDSSTFAPNTVDGSEEDTFYDWYLDPTDLLVGTNVLAVELHQRSLSSSDVSLDYELIATDTPLLLIREPYLNQNTSDGMVVQWRTTIATDSVLEVGVLQGALTVAASDPTLTTEHRLVVTGLLPDQLYHYAVGDTAVRHAGDDGSHTFNTAPLPGTVQPSRFWFVGDAGTANDDQRAVRDAFYTWTGARDPDLFLLLGDNAYGSGTDSEYQAALFDIYPATLKTIPVWSTLGNHDGYSADSATMTGPYYDIFDFPMAAEVGGVSSGTEAYYSFDYANVHFICLDSYGSDRLVGGAMLTWLESDLQATTADWVIAYWHHPPYTKGSHDSDTETGLIEMRENAVPMLEDYGVDLVLSGHSHSYERSYLVDDHIGDSTTFDSAVHGLDMGNGDELVDGAYEKASFGPAQHEGAVFITAGSSGKISGGALDHPVMQISLNELGSVVVDVDGDRMDVWFLNDSIAETDRFTIVKGVGICGSQAHDDDLDGVCSGVDNCPLTANPDQFDLDADGFGDSCDLCPLDATDDADGDGVCEDIDNCPGTPNTPQIDVDLDGIGDACDNCVDSDSDLVCEPDDDCPLAYDPAQSDLDLDGLGDVCDLCINDPLDDLDADGWCADVDVCPDIFDAIQDDTDGDGLGDACDGCPTDSLNDWDGDGVCGDVDVCPFDVDAGQEDADGDGQGDACDNCLDDDVDGICAPSDNCTGVANASQIDGDFDGLGDDCDSCPADPLNDVDGDGVCGEVDLCPALADPYQADADLDGLGDGCDVCATDAMNDVDGDGICGDVDNCPYGPNADQADVDGNGIGDVCDVLPCPDGDGDGACDSVDNCLVDANADQSDLDFDGLGDVCDGCVFDALNDGDGDGICGELDLCPAVADLYQLDSDADGLGDACDGCMLDPANDVDGDGVCGDVDNCPVAANPGQEDGDLDGLGDDCDVCLDLDVDGACDVADNCFGVANPTQVDSDFDGLGDECDACPDDSDNDLDGDGVCGDVDTCPDLDDPGQEDADADGLGDACDGCALDPDNDLDGDGLCGDVDNCSGVYNPEQADRDGDGEGDVCEQCPDVDGDGLCDDVIFEPGGTGQKAGTAPEDLAGCGCVSGGAAGGPWLVMWVLLVGFRREQLRP
jgi:hypothetical protein